MIMKKNSIISKGWVLALSLFIAISMNLDTMADTTQVMVPVEVPAGVPVMVMGDTVFSLYANLGPFSVEQRAVAANRRLQDIVKNQWNPEAILAVDTLGLTTIMLDTIAIVSITNEDAILLGKSQHDIGIEYVTILQRVLKEVQRKYSSEALLKNTGIAVLFLLGVVVVFWVMMKMFPKGYALLERWEKTVFHPIKFRGQEILSAGSMTAFFIALLKGIRLIISLAILYFFIVYVLALYPGTATWKVKPLLEGLLLAVLVTVAAVILVRGVNVFFKAFVQRIQGWRGTLIKPVMVKTVQVLSEERIAEIVTLVLKIVHFAVLILLAYFYITLVFSFFDFTKTWASTLIGYILAPLGKVLISFVTFLPSLFFIVVIVVVTRYVIKFIRLFFKELDRGTIVIPGFYPEWVMPTYKIVRFLVLVFAGIVIFPYLPGSSSPVFRGASILLGVLFSLGSTAAVANMVAGVVLTYMRPFKVGDRVKIADAIGDVIEKTLLVTRVRTIKNVDITIPNAMVLGSHIINFSSSALERGLILHTSVTIGYDAPWRKVHQLLKDAANATEYILKTPEPFILQTSLDDFYVSYELNAYTDQPNIMAKIYSELHQNIQDKFNEAGVEIMSPHYSQIRDGNRTAIPDEYLPKGYTSPAFRIFPIGGGKTNQSDNLNNKNP
jgi:small-conductance mechanosensitive channel